MVKSLLGTGNGLAGSLAPSTVPTGVSAFTGRKPFLTNSSWPAVLSTKSR